jgi:hypothetical protein
MTIPDFEIYVHLSAGELVSHDRPDLETSPEGDRVRLSRKGQRRGLPESIEPGGRYADVDIDASVTGTVASDEIG